MLVNLRCLINNIFQYCTFFNFMIWIIRHNCLNIPIFEYLKQIDRNKWNNKNKLQILKRNALRTDQISTFIIRKHPVKLFIKQTKKFSREMRHCGARNLFLNYVLAFGSFPRRFVDNFYIDMQNNILWVSWNFCWTKRI